MPAISMHITCFPASAPTHYSARQSVPVPTYNVTNSGSTLQRVRAILYAPWPTGGEVECDYLSAHSKKSSTRST